MRNPRDINPKALASNIKTSDLRRIIEDSLIDGYEVSIWAWLEEARAADGISWRINKKSVLFSENHGRADNSTFKAALKDFDRTEKRYLTPPAVTGLPTSAEEWEEFAQDFRYFFDAGLAQDVSVELRTLLPGSQRRNIYADEAAKTIALNDEQTLYYLEWSEPQGGSSTEWIEQYGTNLLDTLLHAVGQIDEALTKMAEEDERQRLWRERVQARRATAAKP
jgi:hypothetical protein